MTNFPHKHALITGAAVRVGCEIARHLARDGWDITVHYRSSASEAEALATEIRALGRKAATVQADFDRPESAGGLFSALPSPVTLLVHNASEFEKDSLRTVTEKQLRRHMNTNLFSPLLLTQAFVKQVPPETRGDVICLLDGLSGWSISPHYLSYSLSKLALRDAVTLLARDLAPQTRINGIAMGATLPGKEDSPSTFEKIAALSPLGVTSHPGEVCAAIDFLLASGSTTGHIVDLSGGMGLAPVHAAK